MTTFNLVLFISIQAVLLIGIIILFIQKSSSRRIFKEILYNLDILLTRFERENDCSKKRSIVMQIHFALDDILNEDPNGNYPGNIFLDVKKRLEKVVKETANK
jgi:hypothetical protein